MDNDFNLGFGYNPWFASPSFEMPGDIRYIEAGHDILTKKRFLQTYTSNGGQVSLHLSRAPWCEDLRVQQRFCRDLRKVIESFGFTSVGIHLCGAYDSPLGRFGLGVDFHLSKQNQQRTISLAEQLRNAITVPVLIENANLYSSKWHDIADVIGFTNQVSRDYGISQIVDITHSYVAASNNRISRWSSFMLVEWDLVDVVHVSGFVVGKDGRYHDGHNRPVHSDIWEILEEVVSVCGSDTIYVLEHTHPSWSHREEQFSADLQKLREVVSSVPRKKIDYDFDQIASGYLKNFVFRKRLPHLSSKLRADELDRCVDEWRVTFNERLSSGEILGGYLPDRIDGTAGDENYVDIVCDFDRFSASYIAQRGG